jgi:hypothetical protein
MLPDATILIATRNRAPLLAITLASIVQQGYSGVEVLVVDDASSDGTQAVVAGFSGLVRSIRIERPGGFRTNPSPVLNLGHALARADVVIEQGGEVVHVNDCVTPLLSRCVPGRVVFARTLAGTVADLELVRAEVAAGTYRFPPDVVSATPRTCGDRVPIQRVGPGSTRIYCGSERQMPFMFMGAIHRRDFDEAGRHANALTARNDEDLANRLKARPRRFIFCGSALGFHLNHDKT